MDIIRYTLGKIPPGSPKFMFATDIKREDINNFAQSLHSLCLERDGMAWYGPNRVTGGTECFYEWHRATLAGRFSQRCVVHLTLRPDGPMQIEAFVHGTGDPVAGSGHTVPPADVEAAHAEILAFLSTGEEWITNPPEACYLFVRYLKMPFGFRNDHVCHTPDDMLYVYPSVQTAKGDHVCAVVINSRGACHEIASRRSQDTFHRLTLVLCLVCRASVDAATVPWETPEMKSVAHPGSLSALVYPEGAVQPVTQPNSAQIGELLAGIWHDIAVSSDHERTTFLTALEAVRMAYEVDHTEPVLGVICRIAGLASLARGLREAVPRKSHLLKVRATTRARSSWRPRRNLQAGPIVYGRRHARE